MLDTVTKVVGTSLPQPLDKPAIPTVLWLCEPRWGLCSNFRVYRDLLEDIGELPGCRILSECASHETVNDRPGHRVGNNTEKVLVLLAKPARVTTLTATLQDLRDPESGMSSEQGPRG